MDHRLPPDGAGIRQLVVFGVVLAVAVLLIPVAATAAGSLVSIVDGNGTSKAQVDSGKLRVGDGSGAMTVNGALREVGEALEPVRFQESFTMPESTSAESSLVYTVPNGKRLVIDTVAVRVSVPTGQAARASVSFTTPEVQPGSASFSIPVQSDGTFSSQTVYTGIEDTQLLIDPGEQVFATVLRSGPTGSATGTVTASGHLVDLP